MSAASHTLARPSDLLVGPRLHRRGRAAVQLRPAAANSGILLVRRDLDPPLTIPATLARAIGRARRTELVGDSGVLASTVEHLLAALWGLRVYDAEVWLDGPEPPVLDGSAAPIVKAALAAGLVPLETPPPTWVVRGSFKHHGCHLAPHEHTCIECSIGFDNPAIGVQFLRIDAVSPETFATRLAPARTFGLASEAAALLRRGLARGASLGNVLVFGAERPLNPGGTRFADEPVRHKVLDAMGDLALLGGAFKGRLGLRRHSHRHLVEALRLAVEAGILTACPPSGRAGITAPGGLTRQAFSIG